MPRVQRSLSAENLHRRLHISRERQENRSLHSDFQDPRPPNTSTLPTLPPSASPPSPPRDLEALRSRGASPIFRISLSTKLPDPPVSNETNEYVPFDDWKMRIQEKLTNSDHYPIESFRITYIITRPGEETAKYTSLRRRQRLYSSTNDLLSHLSNSYERSLSIVQQEYSYTYKKLKQDKRLFSESYIEFNKYAEHKHTYDTPETIKQHIIRDLQDRVKNHLRKIIIESQKHN